MVGLFVGRGEDNGAEEPVGTCTGVKVGTCTGFTVGATEGLRVCFG